MNPIPINRKKMNMLVASGCAYFKCLTFRGFESFVDVLGFLPQNFRRWLGTINAILLSGRDNQRWCGPSNLA